MGGPAGGFSLEQLQFLSGEAPRKNAIFSIILGLFSVICGAIISPNGARTGELGAFFTEIEENGILGSLLMRNEYIKSRAERCSVSSLSFVLFSSFF